MTSRLEPKVINLSLPKCGSTSIDRFSSRYCNSTHEVWHSGMTEALVKYKLGLYPKPSLLNYFDFKYLATEVEVDSSTYNHFVFEDLIRRYPNTFFISVLREPLSWCCSMLNMWGYFARVVDFAKQDPNSYDLREIRTWISWINRYGILYAPSLNSFSVFRACQTGSLEQIIPTFEQLILFWIDYHKRLMATFITRKEPIKIFEIGDLDSLASYLSTLFGISTSDNLSMPIENQKMPVTINAEKFPKTINILKPTLFEGLCDQFLIEEAAKVYAIALNKAI